MFLLLLTVKYPQVFSQEEAWDQPVSRSAGETVKYGLIAGAETLVPVAGLTVFNYLVQQTSWSLPTKESVRQNLTTSWIWEDTDDFAVNQIGHPIQGLFSFGAGRVNGFNFYQSVVFNSFGSFMWETFGESNMASINDFITTTTGSMATGEMFYRLYIEACAQGVPAPLAFIINPMVGFHRLVTGWKPPNTEKNLYRLQLHFGGALAETHYSIPNSEDEVFSFKGPLAEIGANVIYGNPFEQDTRIPYRHFELDISYGLNLEEYNHLRIISDGYLFSFSPIYTERDTMSTGISMHFDFQTHGKFGMEDATVDQYSNALDWTAKYQHKFSQDTLLQLKLHAGVTFFGASKYFADIAVINDYGHVKTDYNNFGGGLNSKLFSILENKWGRLEMSAFYYVLWTFPGTTHFSHGNVYWLYTDLAYYQYLTKHFSLGIAHSYVMERGSFSDGYPDTRKSNEVLKLLVVWNL